MAFWQLQTLRYGVRVQYEVQQSLPENRSTVTLTGLEICSLWDTVPTSCWVTGRILLNGIRAAELILTNTHSCGIVLSGDYFLGDTRRWSGMQCTPVTIDHAPDGTMQTLELQAELTILMTNGTRLDPGISTRLEVTLPRIPRVTAIRAEPVTLGQEMEIRLESASRDFQDTVTWHCGSRSGVIASDTGLQSIRWVPAQELAEAAPESETVPLVLQTVTSLAGTEIGRQSIAVPCRVPENVVPTAAVTLEDAAGFAEQFGGYLQEVSRLRVRAAAQGTYGAGVRSVDITCGALQAKGENVTFALPDSGQIPVTVTVTDTRGRKITVNQTVQILPYQKPDSEITGYYRCDSLGNEKQDGDYVKLLFRGTATNLAGSSTRWYVLRQLQGNTAAIALPQYNNRFQIADGEAVIPVAAENTYLCGIRAEDSFGAAESRRVTVPPAMVLLDFCRRDASVGIGMPAKRQNTLSMGLTLDMEEHRIAHLAAPVQDDDAVTKAYVDGLFAQYFQNGEERV